MSDTIINTLDLSTGEVDERLADAQWLVRRQQEIDQATPIQQQLQQRQSKQQRALQLLKEFDFRTMESELDLLPIGVRPTVRKLVRLIRLTAIALEMNDTDIPT